MKIPCKKYFEVLFFSVLFILVFFTDGYILGVPLIYFMGYLSIPVLIYNGMKKIKNSNKVSGGINLTISLGLLIMLIKQFI